ncbi:MAG: DUF262 domain-containing protein, partial [Synergistaceae bacterium]|nr:DUF262 domain-containing protein [Synergistaceae bacterium]
WKNGDSTGAVLSYGPYYMGELIISQTDKGNTVIDGQQRMTTLTLLLIFIYRRYGSTHRVCNDLGPLVYKDYFGSLKFPLDIEEREKFMLGLLHDGTYEPNETDTTSVRNIVARYNDITTWWDGQDSVDDDNVEHFTYWLTSGVLFSKVWTNSDTVANIIFETMNDRGLSLTQTEMLRSYLLNGVGASKRDDAIKKFNNILGRLVDIYPKAESDFFKIYLRTHYAKELSQKKANSDFTEIGSNFYRWIRSKSGELGLQQPSDFIQFLDGLDYFSKVYQGIYERIKNRDTDHWLYLIVNSDYGFTLQPALLLAAVANGDRDKVVEEKIQIVSKFLTQLLSWRIWNRKMISQRDMEEVIYRLCKDIRSKNIEELKAKLNEEAQSILDLGDPPFLNQQNKTKMRVLLALITEIVARESKESGYLLNKKQEPIEIEHIWSDHYEQHKVECADKEDFASVRNNIGDLLLLPKSVNGSYGDSPYSEKVEHYLEQNILAQSLHTGKYKNTPNFKAFRERSGLAFKSYDDFKRGAIRERAELYKNILKWNWRQ